MRKKELFFRKIKQGTAHCAGMVRDKGFADFVNNEKLDHKPHSSTK